MAARADQPESANGLRKALRATMKHAVEIGLRADDPTRDVKALRPKSKLGFHRWTEAEIAQFEARHPVGQELLQVVGLAQLQAGWNRTTAGVVRTAQGTLDSAGQLLQIGASRAPHFLGLVRPQLGQQRLDLLAISPGALCRKVPRLRKASSCSRSKGR